MPTFITDQKPYIPIPLNPNAWAKIQSSFQATIKPRLYSFHQDAKSGKYYFKDPSGNLVLVHHFPVVCAFVVLKNATDSSLELVLGEASHAVLAGGAPEVYAAGDICFDQDALATLPFGTNYFSIEIIKLITDRSGAYHVSTTDPLLSVKRDSARTAMIACGLPTEKFNYFHMPQETRKSQPLLLFSDVFAKSADCNVATGNTSHDNSTAKNFSNSSTTFKTTRG
jgi:hypothetical protein